MVVVQLVQVSNITEKTYRVQAGDPFYTPTVNGEVVDVIEVRPGFDASTKNLTVPWESVTQGGLTISVDGSDEVLRCVIGPNEDRAEDWLRFHSKTWEPVAKERWIPVGPRHFLGAVGSTLELQLRFDEPSLYVEGVTWPPKESDSLVDFIHFQAATAGLPRNTVLLNVFDLASILSMPNAVLNNTMVKSMGAFHAAIEVYGEEWSFYRTPNPDSCGICLSVRPKYHPVHVFRQTVVLGETSVPESDVRQLMRLRLAPRWRGRNYDLLHRNCIHFCEELAGALGVSPVPDWVTGAHELGAGLLSIGDSIAGGMASMFRLASIASVASVSSMPRSDWLPPKSKEETSGDALSDYATPVGSTSELHNNTSDSRE